MIAKVEPERGVRLDQWLDQRPRAWREIADIFFDVAQALSLAHAAGIVYQEIRVEQIVVGPDGRGSLFNLEPAGNLPTLGPPVLRTAAIPLEQRLAALDSIETASYLAPEQFRGGTSNALSNQFSYCVALYRALYRQVPFDHDWAVSDGGSSRSTRTPLGSVRFDLFVKSFDRTTLVNLVREVLSGNLRQPPYDSDVPGWLEQIVRRGLQADPEERFPSMSVLLHDLAGNLGAAAKARLIKPRRRFGTWVLVGGLGLLLLAGALIALLGRAH